MTKDQLAQLYSEIAGGSGLLGEEAFEVRQKAETQVGVALLEQYWGFISSGDAYHQFYLDTLRELGGRLPASTQNLLHYFFYWHILAANRHHAIFDLFKRGWAAAGLVDTSLR
ncbi:MAG: hypothetical protein ACREBU_22115 [Nitrososphaera sp.]